MPVLHTSHGKGAAGEVAETRLYSGWQRRGGLAERKRVAAGRCAEHAAVLAAELRGAVVADRESDTGDVPGFGEEPGPGFVQADLLLELDGCHRGEGPEVAVEGSDAHRRERGEILDAQGLIVMAAIHGAQPGMRGIHPLEGEESPVGRKQDQTMSHD